MSLKFFTALLFAIACLPSAVQAAKLYKWVDEDGHTHYSDKVPPSEVRRARSELDKHGITIDKVEAAKTAQQLRQEAEEKRLRMEQARLVEKQRQEDRVLLRTFRSEDDIIMTRDSQIQSVDTYIRVTQANIKRLKNTLSEMQKNAAQLELGGKTVSQRYLNTIESKRQALKDAYQSIVEREKEKNRIRQAFAHDLNRFRALRQLEQTNDPIQEASQSYTDALLNVYNCGSDLKCEVQWIRAKAYAKEHSTTPTKMVGENIVMASDPLNNDDISITVSRILDRKTGQTLIFMDLQCKEASTENAACSHSEKIQRIKENFHPSLEGSLPAPNGPREAEVASPAHLR
jgi:hypothetical protein